MSKIKINNMANFKDRLLEEKKELDDRKLKLALFLDGDKVLEINPIQADLLNMQLSAMETYSQILHLRISLLEKEPA